MNGNKCCRVWFRELNWSCGFRKGVVGSKELQIEMLWSPGTAGDQSQLEVGPMSGDPRKQQWLETQQEDGGAIDAKQFISPETKHMACPVLLTAVYHWVASWKEEDQEPGKPEMALGCCWQHTGLTRGPQGQGWEALKIQLCSAKEANLPESMLLAKLSLVTPVHRVCPWW